MDDYWDWMKLLWQGITNPVVRLMKIQTTSRSDHIWLDALTRIGNVIKKLLFHAKDSVPEHAYVKPLFQNNKSRVWSKIHLYWYCRERLNPVQYHNLVHECVPMKRSEESSSLYSLILRWKLAHAVSSRDVAYLWQKNSSSNPTTWWARDTLKCGLGKKEVQTPDVVLLSESQVYTLIRGCTHKWNVQPFLEICLSETLVLGNREYVQKIFHLKQCWFQTQR